MPSFRLSRLILIITAMLTATSSWSQTKQELADDLQSLYNALKKTPSYKAQIRGTKKKEYEKLYENLQLQTRDGLSDAESFSLLSKLLLPIRDNHLFFYQYREPEIQATQLLDSNFIRQCRQTDFFKNYPRVSIDLLALEARLSAVPKDSVEGIYYFESMMKAGVYRTGSGDSLIGVVLESYIPTWEKGQILFFLHERLPGRFIAIGGQLMQKTFGLYKNVKFINGRLTQLDWTKTLRATDYVNISHSSPVFLLSSLAPDIRYLRLGSFATYPAGLAISAKFYDSIKDSLDTPYLVVDLRNNGGGGFKASGKYLALLKKYSTTGQIYVLVNNETVSNAEEFTIALMKWKNVTIMGETTNGTVTYGNNADKVAKMKSGKYRLYITDMKGTAEYLAYEELGITPQLLLSPDKDWLDQTLSIIRQGQ